ncbi:MAG: hypothetical protein ACK5ZA_04525 [Betaproteobacteria bacterium]|jgi:hypothetical protein|nr:hypothetical protein [Phycisphaerales bacterium]MCE2654239.1 hypothetical protein [Planctomycetaceae bacterium]
MHANHTRHATPLSLRAPRRTAALAALLLAAALPLLAGCQPNASVARASGPGVFGENQPLGPNSLAGLVGEANRSGIGGIEVLGPPRRDRRDPYIAGGY